MTREKYREKDSEGMYTGLDIEQRYPKAEELTERKKQK